MAPGGALLPQVPGDIARRLRYELKQTEQRAKVPYPEMYPQYLKEFREKIIEMMAETTHPGARSKLQWMQRYHRRILKAARRR